MPLRVESPDLILLKNNTNVLVCSFSYGKLYFFEITSLLTCFESIVSHVARQWLFYVPFSERQFLVILHRSELHHTHFFPLVSWHKSFFFIFENILQYWYSIDFIFRTQIHGYSLALFILRQRQDLTKKKRHFLRLFFK